MPRPDPPAPERPPPLPIARLNAAERIACLRLIRSENVGPVSFRELINHFGGAQSALEALPELAARGGQRRPVRLCSKAAAEAELEAAENAGARPVFTIEPGYPAALALIDVPPPLLYIKGLEQLLNEPTIAIVGSRQASAAGQNLARRFASILGEAGYVIASGLALGIDAAAHQAALKTGTVAALAGGVDCIYPPQNAVLHGLIATGGCLVSEQPPGFQPRGKDFPRRNRIISGLSRAVVVVEAARRSGSLITARMAAEQGRDVFAIPGNPLDPRAEGTNQLLKDGATIATEPQDVILALRPLSGAPPFIAREQAYRFEPHPEEPLGHPGNPEVPHDLTRREPDVPSIGQNERSLLINALGAAPVNINEIVRSTRLPVATVQMGLLELSLAGRIRHHGSQLVSLTVEEN